MQKNQIKVALITGAARRIGAAIANHLHAQGVNVIIHYHRSQAEAFAVCARLNQIRAASAVCLCADLSDITSFSGFVQQAVEAWGRLDLLVNNASRFYPTTLGQVQESAWDDLMTSNVKAPFFLAQAVAPFLREQEGSIINIADVHGERPMREYSAYCISKAALIMLTKSLAKEWGPLVRVNAISPGMMLQPEGDNTLTPAVYQKIQDRIVLKREGEPSDIAKTVVFLMNSAPYVTGQIWAVDGGRSLMI